MTHHEPMCPGCGRYDANCDCTLRVGKACMCEPMNLVAGARHDDPACPFYEECPGCWECEEPDWPMPKPPPYPADDEDQPMPSDEKIQEWADEAERGYVRTGMGGLEPIDEAYTDEGARLVRIQHLKDTMSFDHLADLYLTLTDGIVRERLARREAEHTLYKIKQLAN